MILSPSFDPPKRWKREDLSNHQYISLLCSLKSQLPINTSSNALEQSKTSAESIKRSATHSIDNELKDSDHPVNDAPVMRGSSNKRPRIERNYPPTEKSNSVQSLSSKLGLFDGAIEVDLGLTHQSRNSNTTIIPTQPPATITTTTTTSNTSTSTTSANHRKSLFSKLLTSGGMSTFLDEEDDNIAAHIKAQGKSVSPQVPATGASSTSTNVENNNSKNNSKKGVSLGKILSTEMRLPSVKGKLTQAPPTIQPSRQAPNEYSEWFTSESVQLKRQSSTESVSDRISSFNQSSSKISSSNSLEKFSPADSDDLEFTLTEFEGIQKVCRNAGATMKGLEAFVQRLTFNGTSGLGSSTNASIEPESKPIVSMSFLYKDMTSNHATSSVKYCTPSTTASCRLWYCSCDRNVRSHVLRNALVGVVMIILDPDERISQDIAIRPSSNLPFFLPLALCIEPDSKDSWRLDAGLKLPIQCETTLADRWKAFHQILSSSYVVKIVYNMQVALLPVFHAIESWNSSSTVGYEWLHMFPFMFDPKIVEYLLNSDVAEESLELLELQVQYQLETPSNDSDPSSSQGIVARNIVQLAKDLQVLLNLYFRQSPNMAQKGLLPLYWKVECPTSSLLSSMELHGVSVNYAAFRSMKTQLDEAVAQISKSIFDSVGFKFNISSPEQVSHVLFEKLHLQATASTTASAVETVHSNAVASKKFPSTSEEELQKIVHAHPVVRLILDYRSVTKLLCTYIEGMVPYILRDHCLLPSIAFVNVNCDSDNYSVHAYWNQTAVRTGRLSCCKPNLQNIPGEQCIQDIKYNIRGLFQPRSNCFLVAADYSQIEMRILAHVSGDSSLSELFRTEGDIYRLLAAKIFKKSPGEVSDDERTRAKVICLGVLYGMGPQSAATNLGIDVVTASKITNSFFNSFSQVKTWIQRVKTLAKQVGHVKTMMGRIRQLSDINNENDSSKRSAAERQAVNSIIQGSASDLIKYAMILSTQRLFSLNQPHSDNEVSNAVGPPRLVMQIHDELIFEVSNCSVEYLHTVISTLTEVMEKDITQLLQFRVPLLVNVSVGKNWGELHLWQAETSEIILQSLLN